MATASYTDSNGVQQTAQSNVVQSLIQQVGSFTLSPPTATPSAATGAGYTKSAAPGSTVYMQYTVTNTGNGSDNFTLAVADAHNTDTFAATGVYADVNQDGLPDSSSPISGAVTIGAGTSYTFVVAYTLPSSATTGWTDQGTVTATAANGAIGYGNLTLTRTDTVNATLAAAFSANTSIALPPSGAQAWWSPSTTPSSGKVGTSTIYTITYVNNGGAAGPVYIKDQLPVGFTYVASSGAWSGAIGTQLDDADASNPSGISYKVGSYSASTGTSVEAVVANVVPGQSGTISFRVLASAGAGGANTLIGTSTTNNAAAYTASTLSGGSCTTGAYTVANCNGSTTVSTNAAPFTVLATRAVVMTSSSGTTTTGADATAPTGGNAAGDGSADTVTVASAVPGGSIKYTFKVFNTGNDTDTFLLGFSSAAGTNTFPAGTTYNWFQSDGVTPLQATAGKGVVDTGPLAAGASTTLILQVVVPAATTAPQSGSPLYKATAQATSVNDATVEDGAKAQLTALAPGYVDLTQTVAAGTAGLDQGPGTTTAVQGIAVTAGGTGNNSTASVGPSPAPAASSAGNAVFKLIVNNNDSGALTFNLSAASTSSFPGNLPAGWTVEYYTDAAATTLAAGSAGARNTGSIAAGSSATVYAKVTPPSNASAATYDVYFQAQSTTGASNGVIVSDYLRDQVVVAAASTYSMTLGSNGSLQASAGGSATYSHTLANTGTQACGSGGSPLSLTVSGLPSGWTYAVYQDAGTIGVVDGEAPLVGTGANGTSPYTIGSVAVNANQPLLVRIFPPGSAAVGTVATATITVTDAANPGCGSAVLTDTTTVVAAGQVQVQKYQSTSTGTCGAWSEPSLSSNLSVKPGDCLMFKTVVTNVGTTAAKNVQVSDAVPAYTTWAATQPAGATACVSSTGNTVTLSSVSSGAAAGTTFTCGTETSLPPGGTLTLRFAVQINQ
ncbi:hypothetical protein [Roseateles sp.]|uniref:beta strand repeat-containing protein n=1 Tax=Roseateles sp. TaxID=1971397 RepID=UPI002E054E61|nr:hypothetical protein [Roseateles sp.]